MANNNSNKKTNTNNKKKNTPKGNSAKKVNSSASKNTNNTKKVDSKVNKEAKNTNPKNVKVEKVEEATVTPVVKEKKSFTLTSKQRDIILVILVAVVLVIALVLTSAKKLNIELPIALEGTPGFTEITYSEYEKKLNTEAPFVVVIVNDGCGFCDKYKPVVEDVADEYKLPIYYINIANLTQDEYYALADSNTYLRKTQWGTPTTLFLYGDTVVDSISQYVDKETFVEFVKENFVVTENEK